MSHQSRLEKLEQHAAPQRPLLDMRQCLPPIARGPDAHLLADTRTAQQQLNARLADLLGGESERLHASIAPAFHAMHDRERRPGDLRLAKRHDKLLGDDPQCAALSARIAELMETYRASRGARHTHLPHDGE